MKKPTASAIVAFLLAASVIIQVAADPAIASDSTGDIESSVDVSRRVAIPILLTISPEVVVGEPVTALMIPRRRGAVARLTDPHGEFVSDAPGFVAGIYAGIEAQAFLLGVESTAPAGEYRLEITVGDEIIADRALQVGTREFRSEEIPLDAALTDLRATWDPEKDREAREMRSLLSTVNPRSVYHLARFIWPVERWRITSWFGDRRTYLYSDGGRANSIHVGLDLGTPEGATPGTYIGEPVFASGAGRVVFANARIVTGNSVVLEHLPGLFSVYYHLDTTAVKVGDQMSAGDLIGTVGMTGLATGPHLHWEFRVRGIAVEPEIMVSRLVLDIRPPFSTITTPGGLDGIAGATERR